MSETITNSVGLFGVPREQAPPWTVFYCVSVQAVGVKGPRCEPLVKLSAVAAKSGSMVPSLGVRSPKEMLMA